METFVVRVFVPEVGGDTPIAGFVEHVGTKWSTRFTDGDELLASLGIWVRQNETPELRTRQLQEEEARAERSLQG